MLKKLVHIIGIFHIVVAVNCMLIGVIVEFHQVHVYKNNISFWHLMATKTVSKDSKKIVKPITDFMKVLVHDYPAQEMHSQRDLAYVQLFENTIYSRQLYDLVSPEYLYDKVLRGPPRA